VIVSLAESADQEAEPVSNLLGLACIRRAACDAVRTARIAVVAWTRQPWQRFAVHGSWFFSAVRAASPSDQARI